MKKLIFLLCIAFVAGCQTAVQDVKIPALGGWDYDWMLKVKKDLSQSDSRYRGALNKVVEDADKALQEGTFTVTSKKMIPPGGSKHDYMSMGPYWWPDPDKPDGLPYIRRDGEVNPERNELDSSRKNKLVTNVRSLALAWFFTGNPKYAEKGAELLRVWFLDKETLMNPHLEYAQAIPGITPGRFIGVIDGASFHILVDAISILETSGALPDTDIEGLRNWFTRYFRWLTESEHGKKEDDYKNNHSVAYDVQAMGIAYYIGDFDFVARKAREMPRRRIDPMIEEDGRQPEELIRTKAFSYSVGNLGNFFNAGEKGLKVGVNFFAYQNIKGGSIRQALDYLLQFAGNQQDWPYQQINSWDEAEENLGMIVMRAANIYDSEEYRQIWNDKFSERLKDDWRLLVLAGID